MSVVIITFIITSLTILVVMLAAENRNLTDEKTALASDKADLNYQLMVYETKEQRRREQEAYERGLYDGRKTDTLYRQCLKRYTARDQVKIMMNGEEKQP